MAGLSITPAGGGSGTVTSTSVVTANGVSGSVATATTTPAITLTLDSTTRLASKVIGSTKDMTQASGDVAYTGVGFTPTSIMCIAAIPTGSTVASWGFADSAKTAKAINTYAAVTFDAEGSYLILLFQTTTSIFQYATVKSFDADGFTLTWTKAGSPTGTAVLQFLCFR